MIQKNEKAFEKLLSEIKHVKDAEKLECEISDEITNAVLLSGEVLGEDTLDKVEEIARRHGFHTFTYGLSVMYRNPGPFFNVD